MTSHPKRPRDDLYGSRLQPSQLAALDGWIANQDASLTSGLAELGEGEMTSHDISTFLAILFCVLVAKRSLGGFH